MLNLGTLSHKHTQYSAMQVERKQSEFFPLFYNAIPTNFRETLDFRKIRPMLHEHIEFYGNKTFKLLAKFYTHFFFIYVYVGGCVHTSILGICIHPTSLKFLNIDHILCDNHEVLSYPQPTTITKLILRKDFSYALVIFAETVPYY